MLALGCGEGAAADLAEKQQHSENYRYCRAAYGSCEPTAARIRIEDTTSVHLGVFIQDAGLHLHLLVHGADESNILAFHQLQHLAFCHSTSIYRSPDTLGATHASSASSSAWLLCR